jgi:hypothetical protein
MPGKLPMSVLSGCRSTTCGWRQLRHHVWSRLTSLRLEGSPATDGMDDQDMLLASISSLTALEELHIGCFIGGLGHPADMAATLQPLHRLQALVGSVVKLCLVHSETLPLHEVHKPR